MNELKNTLDEINIGLVEMYITWYPFFIIFHLIGITGVLAKGHYRIGITSFLYTTISFAIFYCFEMFFFAYLFFFIALLLLTPITFGYLQTRTLADNHPKDEGEVK